MQVSVQEAERRIEEVQEPYKKEILDDILKKSADTPITIYHIGEKSDPNHWWDLCAGPHVERTGNIREDAFDLETLAGNPVLLLHLVLVSSRVPWILTEYISSYGCIHSKQMKNS